MPQEGAQRKEKKYLVSEAPFNNSLSGRLALESNGYHGFLLRLQTAVGYL